MGLLKAERRLAGLGRRELVGPTRNVADPQRSHELEAGQPSQVLGVPFPQLRVLRLLADDGVLHDGVAEVIHHRCDGEDAAQPLVQTVLHRGCYPVRKGGAARLAPAPTSARPCRDCRRENVNELLDISASMESCDAASLSSCFVTRAAMRNAAWHHRWCNS